MLLAALALLPGDAPASLAGRYRVQQTEIGGGRELSPNRHFRYALSYGAACTDAILRSTASTRRFALFASIPKMSPKRSVRD